MELITLGLFAAFLTYEINRSHTDRLFNAASRLGAGDLYGARTLLSVVKWSPALGKQRNLWALCLNLDAHLDIIAGEENTARQKIDKILSKPGLLPAVRGLVFQREAELQASWPEKRQAFLDQAEELFVKSYADIDREQLWKPLSYFFYATCQYELTLRSTKEALKLEPRSAFLRYLQWLCRVYLEQTDAEVLEAAEQAIPYADSQQLFWILHDKAARLWDQGNYDGAIASTQQCLQIKLPKGFEFLRARAYSQLVGWKLHGGSDPILEKLLETAAGPEPDFYHRVVEQLLYVGDVAGAEHYLNGLPTGQKTLLLQALLKCRLGQPETAAEFLSQVKERDRTYQEIELYIAVERCEWTKSMELAEGDEHRETRASLCLVWKGDPQMARELVSEPLTSSELKYYGDFNRLIRGVERVLEATEDMSDPYSRAQKAVTRANLSLYLEDWSNALNLYRKYRQAYINDPYHFELTRLYELTCRCWLGEDLFEECVQQRNRMEQMFHESPKMVADANFALTDATFGCKRYQDVIELSSAYLPSEPRAFFRALLLDLRARSYLNGGQAAEAFKDFEEILKTVPDSYLANTALEQLRLMTR